MRPAALMRGATWNATSSLAILRPVSPLASSNACSPTVWGPADRRSSPTRAGRARCRRPRACWAAAWRPRVRFYTVHVPVSEGDDDGALSRAVLVREGFN